MDVERARELLTVLADGVNPLTGEVLPDSDSCNQVEIVRALHTAVVELQNKQTRIMPENTGKPWLKEDEAKLLFMYRNGTKSSEIAKVLGRSRGAVAARLVHLGEIADRFELK